MRLISVLVTVLSLVSAGRCLAVGAQACPDRIESSGKLDFQQVWARKSGQCVAQVTYREGSKSRSISSSSSGSVFVFSNFGSGSNTTSTGTRGYFLFPRTGETGFRTLTDGDVDLRTGAQLVRISSQTGKVKSMTLARFTDDGKISGSNRGGVEIQSYDGILLDAGWRRGASPYALDGSSVFKDAHGNVCPEEAGKRIPNSKLFKRVGDEFVLKFEKDVQLAVFLKSECPHLDLSRIVGAAPSPVSSKTTSTGSTRAH